MPFSEHAFDTRLALVESRAERAAKKAENLDVGVGLQAVSIARHEERLDGHDDAINRLADTINKGVWALVGFSFTIAASAVGLAITLGGSGP